jgi:Family of unknown function (DUF6982)
MASKQENRVVARFRDGAMVRGTTIDFSPMRGYFHLNDGVFVHEVNVAELKALFFVREFDGNATYDEKKGFFASGNQGKKVMVEFDDGEVMFGYTLNYSSQGMGFFVFPGDPESNNEKIFVVHAATRAVKLGALPGAFPHSPRPG